MATNSSDVSTPEATKLSKPQLLAEGVLVERAQNGDRASFENIVESYRSKVFGTLYHLLGKFEDAEEAFWDVWAEVWSSLPRFRGESSLSTWIYSIASHVAHRKRRKRFLFYKPLEEVVDAAHSGPGPEAEAVRGETYRELKTAIGKLPEHFRLPLVLHAIANLSYEEISEIVKLPVGALKTRVWRAKLELKKVLKP